VGETLEVENNQLEPCQMERSTLENEVEEMNWNIKQR
jgi:hypothetical protein